MTTRLTLVGQPVDVHTDLDVARSPFERLRAAVGLPTIVLAASFVVALASATRGNDAAIVAVLGVLVALWALHRPAVGALAVAVAVPVLPGLRRGFPVGGLRLSELIVVAVAALVLIPSRATRSPTWRRFDYAAIAYVVATGVLGVLAVDGSVRDLPREELGRLAGPAQFFLLYRITAVGLRTAAARRTALAGIVLASIPVSVIGVLQQLDIGPTRELVLDFTESPALQGSGFRTLARATSVFAAWHSLAGYLFLVILLCAALWTTPGQQVLSRRVVAFAAATAAVALVATLTLVAIIAAAIGIAVMVLPGRSLPIRPILAGAVLVVAGGLVFGSVVEQRLESQFVKKPLLEEERLSPVPATVQFRYRVWTRQYLPAMEGRWLIGYGPRPPDDVAWPSTESVYIELLVRGGVVLLAVWCFLMAVWIMEVRRRLAALDPDVRAVARCLFVALVLLLAMHVIHPYFTDAGLPHVLWALTGVLFAAVPYDAGRKVVAPEDPGTRGAT